MGPLHSRNLELEEGTSQVFSTITLKENRFLDVGGSESSENKEVDAHNGYGKQYFLLIYGWLKVNDCLPQWIWKIVFSSHLWVIES